MRTHVRWHDPKLFNMPLSGEEETGPMLAGFFGTRWWQVYQRSRERLSTVKRHCFTATPRVGKPPIVMLVKSDRIGSCSAFVEWFWTLMLSWDEYLQCLLFAKFITDEELRAHFEGILDQTRALVRKCTGGRGGATERAIVFKVASKTAFVGRARDLLTLTLTPLPYKGLKGGGARCPAQ